MSKNSFVKGAFILGMAGVIVKIMGAFFRIPFGNFDGGTEALGYYQTAYPIYVFLLSISTAGFPIAISKMMAEKRIVGNYIGAHKIFKTSLKLLTVMGILTSIVIFKFAEPIVQVLKNPKATHSMIALAPALLFVPIMATFRGYFQGRNNMAPTAVSQVIEQFFRVGVGLSLAFLLTSRGTEYMAAGASFGASAGAILGTIFIMLVYLLNRQKIELELQRSEVFEEERSSTIIKNLLIIAAPIIIGSLAMPIMNLIDVSLIMRRLMAAGYSYDEANVLFGQLAGLVNTVINLPQVMTISIAVSSVPMISEAFQVGDMDKVRKNAYMAIRMATIIGLPAAVGLMVLPTQIMLTLYPGKPESIGSILFVMSFGVYFLSLIQAFVGILQGIGKSYIPVVNLLIAAVFKLICTFTLTGIPSLNVKGAAIGTVLAYIIAFALDLYFVKKYLKMKFGLKNFIIKPLIAVVPMGIAAKLIYAICANFMGNRLSTLIAIAVAVMVYGVLLITTGGITREEIQKIPGGNKVIKWISKK